MAKRAAENNNIFNKKPVLAAIAAVIVIAGILIWLNSKPSADQKSDKGSDSYQANLEKLAKKGGLKEQTPDGKPNDATKNTSTSSANKTTNGTNNTSSSSNKTTTNTGGGPAKPGSGTNSTKQPGSTSPGSQKPKEDITPINEDTGKIDTKPKNIVKQNQTLTIGGLAWKVLGVSTATEISYEKDTDKPAGQFVIVELEAKATGQSTVTIDTEWVLAMDAAFNYYTNNIAAEGLLQFQGKDSLSWLDVAPGQKVEGYIVFDVPKDLKTVELAIFDMDIRTYDYGIITLKL